MSERQLSVERSPVFRCSAFVCFNRSGFSQPGHRSLLKVALGELAGRLKEGSAELTLDQLVKYEIYCLFLKIS